jgi:hypothetical protein
MIIEAYGDLLESNMLKACAKSAQIKHQGENQNNAPHNKK